MLKLRLHLKKGILLDKKFEFVVDKPQRLDIFLSEKLSQSRSQISSLIKKDAVSVDFKKVSKPGLKLKPSSSVFVTLPEIKQTKAKEVDFDVEIIYEDDELMVINKPSGVVVHDAPSVKEATLVDWLKKNGVKLSTISGEERHGIVHRLDKGTSGAMVVAKTNDAHKALSKQLEDKTMGRYYLAVISPLLKDKIVTVDKEIARDAKNRIKMSCVKGGREAKTSFLGLAYSKDEKQHLIACKLYTGRTHQIRVHLQSISRHIIGDEVYGNKKTKDMAERILLHAYMIYFIHPKSKKKMTFKAKTDDYFKNYIEKKFDIRIDENETDLFGGIADKFDNYI